MAINQQLLDQFNEVFDDLRKNISKADLNLRFPNLLNLRVQDDSQGHTTDLVDWTVENLNIRDVNFDKNSTNVVLIEPSQKIKFYISNLEFKLDFTSIFKTNKDILDYTEVSTASLAVKNMSLTFVLKLTTVNETKALRVIVDQILINGQGDKIDFTLDHPGLFIHEFQLFFNVSKDYAMKNIIKVFQDFNEPIQMKIDGIMEKAALIYLNATLMHTPPIYGSFGMVKPNTLDFSPIIYDNFLSFLSYGHIYDQTHIHSDDRYVIEKFLPLYLNVDTALQIFVSERSLNEFLNAYQAYYNSTQQTDNLFNFNCTTDSLDVFFDSVDSFSKVFGTGKACYFKIHTPQVNNVSIAAGDYYIAANLYQITIFVQDDTASSSYTDVVQFTADLGSIIFGFNMASNLIYTYELKNYLLKNLNLDYSKDPKFSPNMTKLTESFNTNLKQYIKDSINTEGLKGTPVKTEAIFGKKFDKFWSSFFNSSRLNLKHEYFQIQVEKSKFEDFSLFEELMYSMFREINNTEPFKDKENEMALRLLSSYGTNEFQQKIQKMQKQKGQIKGRRDIVKEDKPRRKGKKEWSMMESIREEFSFISNELSEMRTVVSKSIFGQSEESITKLS